MGAKHKQVLLEKGGSAPVEFWPYYTLTKGPGCVCACVRAYVCACVSEGQSCPPAITGQTNVAAALPLLNESQVEQPEGLRHDSQGPANTFVVGVEQQGGKHTVQTGGK